MESASETTPSAARKSKAAALRERHHDSPGNDSVASDVTVLRVSIPDAAHDTDIPHLNEAIPRKILTGSKAQPSMQALSITSSVSDKDVFSTYGTQIALQATIRLPQWGNLTKRDEKTNVYLTRVSDKHDELLKEFDDAKEAYEVAAAKRDRINAEADPAQAAMLNTKYLAANTRLSQAERDYHVYSAEIEELREMPQMSRVEAHANDDRKQHEKHECDVGAKKHDSSSAEIISLKHQAKKNEESIAYLTEQLRSHELDSMRSILAQRREITQTGEHVTALKWETARLTSDNRELKALNHFLQRQNEAFEDNPNYCNPAWEDPDNEGVTNANAARRLVKILAFQPSQKSYTDHALTESRLSKSQRNSEVRKVVLRSMRCHERTRSVRSSASSSSCGSIVY